MYSDEEDSRPPYFNGEHYRHWRARMTTYVQSVDYRAWLVIQNGPLPIPANDEGRKHEGRASYTKEQKDALQTNARAKHLLNCALSMEEYAKISSCETAKEIWDKLEILYEGTKQEKEARINHLVHKYELFMMKEDETIEEMFTRFNKIVGDLNALGKSYSNGRQVRKNLWSLPRVWEPKVIAIEIESTNLDEMTIDELRHNLIAFKKIHLQRHGQKEKRRNVASKTILDETESEEDDEEDKEDLAMISKGIYNIMRRRKQKKKSQFDKNSERNNARNNKGLA